jgi:putative membrane protein
MRRTGLGLVLLVGGGVAVAQSTPASNRAIDNTTVAPTMGDEQFARQAAAGGMAELQLSQLAMQRAQSLEVKQFARKMVEDHTKANMELKQIADKQNLPLPRKLDAKQQATYDKLAQLSGADFDREYMKAMTADHGAIVTKFTNESRYGQDAELKSFAMKTLPMLEKHEKMAHTDAAKLKNEP